MLNTLISGALSTATGIAGLGGSDANKDVERRALIDSAKRAALAGSRRDYVQLACWAGAPQGSPLYAEALTYGQVSQGQNCGMPDSVRQYAASAKLEIDARGVVEPLIEPMIAPIVTQRIQNAVASWAPIVLGILLVGVVAWLVLRRRS